MILQEQKIHQLEEKVQKLTESNRKCDRLRKKDRKFLQTLIESSKRDNVPLSEEQCSAFCRQNKVKFDDCEELCSPAIVRCSHWPDSSKCLKHRNFTKREALLSEAENIQLTTTTPRWWFFFIFVVDRVAYFDDILKAKYQKWAFKIQDTWEAIQWLSQSDKCQLFWRLVLTDLELQGQLRQLDLHRCRWSSNTMFPENSARILLATRNIGEFA